MTLHSQHVSPLNSLRNIRHSNFSFLAFAIFFCLGVIATSCVGLPTANQAGIKFSTETSPLPPNLVYGEIGSAKELINQTDKIVVISGGDKPIPLDKWTDFQPSSPWSKNIERNLLFSKTAFYRSPDTDVNCQGSACVKQREYKGYTWVDLAQPVAIDFIPAGSSTDILKPAKGILVVKTIKKCQSLMYKDSIYQLTDNRGNFYVMHATEESKPRLDVSLPKGWTLAVKKLTEPLILRPFGGGNDCYYNIVGDHLGQGYHQYIFAEKFYPTTMTR